ncbi:DUF4238 domain-containing protein [Candidatus Latescibacterota bacterium]
MRHHYIPQLYMRRFSKDGKSISLANIDKALIVQQARIRNQCYRSNLYGINNNLEDAFSKLEGVVANILDKIDNSISLSELSTNEYSNLLTYIVYQNLRTRAHAEDVARSISLMEKDLHINVKKINELDDRSRRDMSVSIALKNASLHVQNIFDLESLVLRINCDYSFITSDSPVIKYNQWCEGVDYLGVTGMINSGLQIFFPISPKCILLFFDSNIYYSIGSTESVIEIDNRNDVHKLNKLQAVFADKNIYFSEYKERDSVLRLINRTSMFRKQREWKRHTLKPNETEINSNMKSEILHVYSVMPNLKLDLSFLRVRNQQKEIPIIKRVQKYRHKGFFLPDNTPEHVHQRLEGKTFDIHSTDRLKNDSDDLIS